MFISFPIKDNYKVKLLDGLRNFKDKQPMVIKGIIQVKLFDKNNQLIQYFENHNVVCVNIAHVLTGKFIGDDTFNIIVPEKVFVEFRNLTNSQDTISQPNTPLSQLTTDYYSGFNPPDDFLLVDLLSVTRERSANFPGPQGQFDVVKMVVQYSEGSTGAKNNLGFTTANNSKVYGFGLRLGTNYLGAKIHLPAGQQHILTQGGRGELTWSIQFGTYTT